jgi:hypothetical protein
MMKNQTQRIIIMPPSKWNQLNGGGSSHGNPFDLASFIARGTVEIEHLRTKCEGEEYTIETVEPVLREEAEFARLVDRYNDSLVVCGKYAPLMTWHGTRNPDTISKIVASGYRCAGEIDEETGKCVAMQHGNAYGDGIYTSVHFDKSFWYTFMDDTGRTVLLINLVLLGRLKFIGPHSNVYLQPVPGSRTWQHIMGDNGEAPDEQEYDTLALPDLREVRKKVMVLD